MERLFAVWSRKAALFSVILLAIGLVVLNPAAAKPVHAGTCVPTYFGNLGYPLYTFDEYISTSNAPANTMLFKIAPWGKYDNVTGAWCGTVSFQSDTEVNVGFASWVFAGLQVEQQDFNGNWHYVGCVPACASCYQFYQDNFHQVANCFSQDIIATGGCLNPPCFNVQAWTYNVNQGTSSYAYNPNWVPQSLYCQPIMQLTFDVSGNEQFYGCHNGIIGHGK